MTLYMTAQSCWGIVPLQYNVLGACSDRLVIVLSSDWGCSINMGCLPAITCSEVCPGLHLLVYVGPDFSAGSVCAGSCCECVFSGGHHAHGVPHNDKLRSG